MRFGPPALALLSAVLAGAATPAAKLLLGGAGPVTLAGLFYLAPGLAFAALAPGRRDAEASLRRVDLPWLAGIALIGGVAAPILLMLGLRHTQAATAGLLLNVEMIATLGIAWLVFHESADRRVLAGAALILAGALLLAWPHQGGGLGFSWGVPAVAGACVCWGIDNNLTRRVSGADPYQLMAVKGCAAGVVNLVLGRMVGEAWPGLEIVALAVLVGLLGYGVSLVLYMRALRELGAARTGAYFSAAPFVAALLGVVLLRETPTLAMGVASVLMAVGVWLHLTERHAHLHDHEVIEHAHAHVHDEHHQHVHGPDDPPGEPHSHWHRHGRLVHAHPHHPDLHHRHRHLA